MKVWLFKGIQLVYFGFYQNIGQAGRNDEGQNIGNIQHTKDLAKTGSHPRGKRSYEVSLW